MSLHVPPRYFKKLLTEDWQPTVSHAGLPELRAMTAAGTPIYMTPSDLALVWEPVFLAVVQEYANDYRCVGPSIARPVDYCTDVRGVKCTG